MPDRPSRSGAAGRPRPSDAPPRSGVASGFPSRPTITNPSSPASASEKIAWSKAAGRSSRLQAIPSSEYATTGEPGGMSERPSDPIASRPAGPPTTVRRFASFPERDASSSHPRFSRSFRPHLATEFRGREPVVVANGEDPGADLYEECRLLRRIRGGWDDLVTDRPVQPVGGREERWVVRPGPGGSKTRPRRSRRPTAAWRG